MIGAGTLTAQSQLQVAAVLAGAGRVATPPPVPARSTATVADLNDGTATTGDPNDGTATTGDARDGFATAG